MKYDYLIVGSGLFGATCAYELTNAGRRCLVLEKKGVIGGNCYTEVRDDIAIHMFGPHIFHTPNRLVWEWINRFATFNNYQHRVKVRSGPKIYSFPINLGTLADIWGVMTPREAQQKLEAVRVTNVDLTSLKGWSLAQIGHELYDLFVEGYTLKQWGRDPSALPASIIKRIPVRLSFDDRYFTDPYQGIPIGGYTPIFEKLLRGSEVVLNHDYNADRASWNACAERVIYTGAIDELFDYQLGKLPYRSLSFSHERVEQPDFQGVAQMNFTDINVPYTRIVEHKHFYYGNQSCTWITKEFPVESGAGFPEMYPVGDENSLTVLRRYQELREETYGRNLICGGRLGSYRYLDMHQVIGAALKLCSQLQGESNR